MNKLVFILFLSVASWGNSQLFSVFDTIRYDDRTNGTLDSMDVYSGDIASTFDGGRNLISRTGLSTGRYLSQLTQREFNHFYRYDRIRFSALPHLGFAYSFGAQGSQFLQANYSHAFNDSVILDINYDRRVGLGILRNSSFISNNVNLQFQKIGNVYSLNLQAAYLNNNINHPNGISSDSLLEVQGLEFATVNKQDANSNNKVGQVELYNYFDFNRDSFAAIGLITNHEYKIRNRKYLESGSLNEIYDTVFIDSLFTNDKYNIASIANGAGLYYSKRGLLLHGLVKHRYWEYRNLGDLSDSTEIDIEFLGKFNFNNIHLKNELKVNLVGRFQEYSNRLNLSYIKASYQIKANVIAEGLAPTIEQRNYRANNVFFDLKDIRTQKVLRVEGELNYIIKKDEISIKLYGDYSALNDLYIFNGNNWELDSLETYMYSAGISSALRWKALNFHPTVVYSMDNKGFLPQFQAFGRLFLKTRLFKAKRLEMAIGTDVSYMSSFLNRAYIPMMDTYNWNINNSSFESMINLHAFLSFGIQEFRFFFRYENIGYFWNDVRNTELVNYPIASTRMRIGLTWDFFN